MKWFLFCKAHLVWDDTEIPAPNSSEPALLIYSGPASFHEFIAEHHGCDLVPKGTG